MSDLPPPPPPNLPPPPEGPPPGYVPYGQHTPTTFGGYAGFWIRFGALLLDGIGLGIAVGIVGSILGLEPGAQNLLSLVAGVAYYGALEGGPTGQTLGKRVCGIRVVDATSGQPGVGIGRGIGRYFARILSGLVLLLGYLWMLWDDRNQTWHDKLVSTVVVKA